MEKSNNRCFVCNKRLRLSYFECKCSKLFCASHRLPISHKVNKVEDNQSSIGHCCDFDHKLQHREEIKRNNPIVKTSTLEKI